MSIEIKPFLTLPDGTEIPYISETDYLRTMREVVEPALANLRQIEEIPVTGGTLHAENYVLPGAKRAIILLHGYTESAEKLRELVWYFLKAGFSVFSYDHRGHGQSLRELEDHTVAHVKFFSEYVNDLENFILASVRPQVKRIPLYLFAHSMGGAVGAQFLIRHPDTFERAILTSPMIAPSSAPLPLWSGRAIAETMCLIGKGEQRAFIGGPYDPEKEPFETSCSTSRARFAYYIQKRRTNPHLQVCSPSYQWVRESVAQTAALLKPQNAGAIKTKVLLCQAGLDTTVRLEEQEQFVSLIPGARLVRFDNAKHEIYNSTDDTMQPYVQTMLDFLLD